MTYLNIFILKNNYYFYIKYINKLNRMRTLFIISALSICFQTLIAQNKAEDYFKQGEIKSSYFDFDGAIVEYKKAIELDTLFDKAYNKLALLYFNNKDYKNAVIYMNHYLRIKPENADALYINGISKFNAEDFVGAISDFDKAISLNSKYVRAYYFRGLVKLKINDNEGAIKDFDNTIKLRSKDNPKLEFADAYYNRAVAKNRIGKNDDACNDWKKAKELGSIDSDRLININCK